jgi:hypothetical protein
MSEEVRDLFELASIKKWRFDSTKGVQSITVEDLWYMPLAKGAFCLDSIAIALHGDTESKAKLSFVTTPRPGAKEAGQKLELVKYIITTRLAAAEATKSAAAKKALKQKIAEVRERKGDAALENMTPEELDAYEATL